MRTLIPANRAKLRQYTLHKHLSVFADRPCSHSDPLSLYRQLAWKLEGIRPVIISCGLSPQRRKFFGVICRLLLFLHQLEDVSFWKEHWHYVILVYHMISTYSLNYVKGSCLTSPSWKGKQENRLKTLENHLLNEVQMSIMC